MSVTQNKIKQQEKDYDEEVLMENKIWEWRKLTVGMKNITDIKKQKVEEMFEELKYPSNDIYIEVYMDMLKFLWKCVLMNKTSLFEFELTKNEYYRRIEQFCDRIDINFSETTEYDYKVFKQDMKNRIEEYNECDEECDEECEECAVNEIVEILDDIQKSMETIEDKWIENNKNWYKKMVERQNERKRMETIDEKIIKEENNNWNESAIQESKRKMMEKDAELLSRFILVN